MLDTEGYKHTQNMQYSLPFNCNNGYSKAAQFQVIQTVYWLSFSYFILLLPFIANDFYEPFIEFQRHSKTCKLCKFFKYLYFARYKLTGFFEVCNLEA